MHSLCTVKGIVWRPPTTLLTAVTPRVRRQPKMVTAPAEHSFFLHNTAWNMMEWCCHTGVNYLQTARRPCGDKTMTTCAHYGSSPACASEPARRTTSGRIKTNGGMLHYPRKQRGMQPSGCMPRTIYRDKKVILCRRKHSRGCRFVRRRSPEQDVWRWPRP